MTTLRQGLKKSVSQVPNKRARSIKGVGWIFFSSESYYVCVGWNFSFITWKFANSVENCSEIVKQACSFKRYLRVLNTKVAKNIELMRMLSDWHLREMEYLRRNWAQTLIDVRLDLCCSSLRGLSFKKLLEGKLCSDFDRCSDFFF